MPCPLLIFSQSDCLIRIVAINSQTNWQTVQIQISWLFQKPTDLDLHCLQRQGISGFSMIRVNQKAFIWQPGALSGMFWPKNPDQNIPLQFDLNLQFSKACLSNADDDDLMFYIPFNINVISRWWKIFFFFFFFFWFGFYGPFKNISLISSWSFIEGGRKPENPEKNHLSIRKQNLAFPHMTRARLEPQRWET